MPAFIAVILGGLINITGSLVGRVLVALGLGVVTYTGLSTSLDFLMNQAIGSFQALGPDVVGMLTVMKVGPSLSIISSAMVSRLAVNGLQSDSIKKWVLK